MGRTLDLFISITVVLCTGCKGEAGVGRVLTELVADTPMSIQLGDQVGSGTLEMPIRQVNSYGVAIPGGAATVGIRGGGATLAQPDNAIEFDSFGYATVLVNVDDGQTFQIQIQTADATDVFGPPATGYRISSEFPEFDLAPTALLPDALTDPERMVSSSHGVTIGSVDEIWEIPFEGGMPAHQVADLPFDISGMWSSHIDKDGVLDLVVWADSQLLLLRGRPGGGYGWGIGWSAQDRSIGGVAAGDVNGDRLTDLVVALTNEDNTIVEVLEGNGRWGFESLAPLELSFPVESITGSDDNRDGEPDVTVLSEATGVLRRYTIGENGWTGGSPPEIASYKANPGSTLLPSLDLDDIGSAEIAVVGPQEGGARELVFYVLDTPPTKYPLAFRAFHLAVQDVDGNGADDILALEEDTLNVVWYDFENGKFISQSIQGMGPMGPIASSDWDDDGLADLGILASDVTYRRGMVSAFGDWTVRSHHWKSYNIGLVGPTLVADFDDNGQSDVVGFTDSESLRISAWNFHLEEDEIKLNRNSQISLESARNPQGLARCGDDIYALVEVSGVRTLVHLQLDASAEPWGLSSLSELSVPVGKRLACGTIEAGATAAVVAKPDGTWSAFDSNMNEIATGEVGPAGAIALGDTDGDGIDEVYGCDSEGCSIVAIDFDGDGLDEIARSTATTTLTAWGEVRTIAGAGVLSATDVDADGRLDLLSLEEATGTIVIHRGMAGTTAPPLALRTERAIFGPVFIGDANGDAISEIFSIDADGYLIHTSVESDANQVDEQGDTGGAEAANHTGR